MLRRVLSAQLLALVTVSLFASPVVQLAAARHCPPAHGATGPIVRASMDDSGCVHQSAGPCASALGCVNVPVATCEARASVAPFPVEILPAAFDSPLHGLFAASPPTPPPNLI